MTSHIRAWKEAKKKEVTELVKDYPFIAVATLELLPANILSVLRKKLKGDAKIVVAKTRVLQKAFEDADMDTSKIDPLIKENIAIIFSKKNPFELFSFIKKNKGETTAKEGDIAEGDIVVQAGDTGIPPGPALSTLKAAGLKVQVAGPTISITNDKIVTKKGEEVSSEVADVLGKLNMKPMKIGMQLVGVLDKQENEFYLADVLNVDEEELFDKFVLAYKQALNLSVNAEYFNDASTEIILIKAEREAKAVNEATNDSQESNEEKETNETENKEEKVEENKFEEGKENTEEASNTKEENKDNEVEKNSEENKDNVVEKNNEESKSEEKVEEKADEVENKENEEVLKQVETPSENKEKIDSEVSSEEEKEITQQVMDESKEDEVASEAAEEIGKKEKQ